MIHDFNDADRQACRQAADALNGRFAQRNQHRLNERTTERKSTQRVNLWAKINTRVFIRGAVGLVETRIFPDAWLVTGSELI